MGLHCRRVERAFSLVELLIVIIVIAVLAAVAIPRFSGSTQRSKESALRGDLRHLRNAALVFKADCGCSPSSLSDLAAASAPASGLDDSGNSASIIAANWKGPYVQSVPNDPISGSAYAYSTTSPNVGKVSSSAGAPYNGW